MVMNPQDEQMNKPRGGLLGLFDKAMKADEDTGLSPLQNFAAALDPLILKDLRGGEGIRQQGVQRAATMSKNKTVDMLRQQGRNDLADAVMNRTIGPKEAFSVMQSEKAADTAFQRQKDLAAFSAGLKAPAAPKLYSEFAKLNADLQAGNISKDQYNASVQSFLNKNKMSIRPFRDINRKKTKVVTVGSVKIGGDNPISVQSMTNTLTTDIEATINQINQITEAGGDLVRVSCPDKESTQALKKIIAPKKNLSFSENFFHMCFGKVPEKEIVKAFDVSLILYAEHSFNVSTFTARTITSSLSDIHGAITGAIASLKGPLHGGANEEVMHMMKKIKKPENALKWINNALKNKEVVMGFGHRVYKSGDSRVPTMREYFGKVAKIKKDKTFEKIYDIVEKVMIKKKNIHPNVDYPTGPTYHLMGFDTDFFTPIFVISRITGWSAHIMEQHAANKLIRPLAKYKGSKHRTVMQLNQR